MAVPQEKRYTSEEFFALEGLPERCELINGYITNMSPSPNIKHQLLSGEIFFEIKSYIKKNNGKCIVLEAPTDVQLDDGTVFIPDIFVVCDKNKLDRQKLNGAPDWVIEIVSPGNVSYDYVTKASKYYEAGVREYWIIDPEKEIVHVYIWDGEKDEVNIYSFGDNIPAGIYRDNEEQLILRIGDYLTE